MEGREGRTRGEEEGKEEEMGEWGGS